ncbi:MAG: hypothetical protein GC159_22510 [Phycisphaera sp.]|nr:hypothetical protein [Phycisphaera sp.]
MTTRRGMITVLLAVVAMTAGCAGTGKRMSAAQRSRAKWAETDGAAPPIRRNDALRVVYLVDATNKPDGVTAMLTQRLLERIDLLEPTQAFTVIFLQGNEALEIEPHGLKFATDDVKAKMHAWLDPAAGNVPEPLAIEPTQALELCRWYHPHHLFILTGDLKRTLPGQYLTQLPPQDETRVNVVQFFNDNEKSLAWVQYVTREHQGAWRFVARPEPPKPEPAPQAAADAAPGATPDQPAQANDAAATPAPSDAPAK